MTPVTDTQYDLFGGEHTVTRKPTRQPEPAPVAVQIPLFATDRGQHDGQATTCDLFAVAHTDNR